MSERARGRVSKRDRERRGDGGSVKLSLRFGMRDTAVSAALLFLNNKLDQIRLPTLFFFASFST